jgi:choline dehydrogenase-like flavoprotein
MNVVEKYFKEKIEAKYNDRHVIIGRAANLTQPVKGRGQCQARDLCHRGCPFGAYFSTNASTMPAAYATGNLTVRPHSLVNKVLYDDKNLPAGRQAKATGVEIIDTETKQTEEFYARIIFLNASTCCHCIYIIEFNIITFSQWIGKWKRPGRPQPDGSSQRT